MDSLTGREALEAAMGHYGYTAPGSNVSDLDIGFNDAETFVKDNFLLTGAVNKKDFPHLDSKSYSVVGLNNRHLQELVVPENYDDGIHGRYPVTAIEGDAFSGSAIEKVVVPPTVIYLLNQAFYGCARLMQINIPKSVEWIRGCCFDGCVSLKKLYLPISVTHIGAGAFDGCRNLEVYTGQINRPKGWSEFWNTGNRPVFWDGQWNWINGVPMPL